MCTNVGGAGRTGSTNNNAPALDSNLIRRANEANTLDNGDMAVRSYQSDIQTIRDRIGEYGITEQEANEAIRGLHEAYTKVLQADSAAVDPYATGRGPARFDRKSVLSSAEASVNAWADVRQYMTDFRNNASRISQRRYEQALTNAMAKALSSGSLEFTVNGNTYARKSKRAKTFERVYG